MRKFSTILFTLLFTSFTFAQTKAITENGEEVYLYENGTWKYVYEDLEAEKKLNITTNPETFLKDPSVTFLMKSKRFNVGFWLNSKKWHINKSSINKDSEFEFQLKNDDLYGMVITEKIEIPLETLRTIAYDNAKASAPDMQIVHEEYRNVNGLNVFTMQMNGTVQGMKISYYGYYYSNENGTIQFITYTSQNLFKSLKSTCEELLNGLVEITE